MGFATFPCDIQQSDDQFVPRPSLVDAGLELLQAELSSQHTTFSGVSGSFGWPLLEPLSSYDDGQSGITDKREIAQL